MGKNVIIFGADMSSSVNIDNIRKYVLILGEGPTKGLDDTTLTAETKYHINVLLISITNTSNHKNCVSLSNQKYVTQPPFTDLCPNEYSQEFHYYPFAVKLDRYAGSCNTFNDYLIKYVFQIKRKI